MVKGKTIYLTVQSKKKFKIVCVVGNDYILLFLEMITYMYLLQV